MFSFSVSFPSIPLGTHLDLVEVPDSISIGDEVRLKARLLGGQNQPIKQREIGFVIKNEGEKLSLDQFLGTNARVRVTDSAGYAETTFLPELHVGNAEVSAVLMTDQAHRDKYCVDGCMVTRTVPVIEGGGFPTELAIDLSDGFSYTIIGAGKKNMEVIVGFEGIQMRVVVLNAKGLSQIFSGQVCYSSDNVMSKCVAASTVTRLAPTKLGSAEIRFNYRGSDNYLPSVLSFTLTVQPTSSVNVSPLTTTTIESSDRPSIEILPYAWSKKNIQVQVTYDEELADKRAFYLQTVQTATMRWQSALTAFGKEYNMPQVTQFTFTVTESSNADVTIHFTSHYICGNIFGTCAGVSIVRESGNSNFLYTTITIGTDYGDDVLEDIVTHEFGHALGLGHVNRGASWELMNRTVGNAMRISTLDLYGLAVLYQGGTGEVNLPNSIQYKAYET